MTKDERRKQMTEIENTHPQNITDPEEDTIDLIALAKTLWKGRKTVIWTVATFTILGVFVARFSPVEYEAKTILLPQVQMGTSGRSSLGSLAALAGVNINVMQGASELSPRVYPQIVQSIPFQRSLMYTPISWNGVDNPVNMIDYLKEFNKPSPLSIAKKYTIGLPRVLLGLFKGKTEEENVSESHIASIISLNPKEQSMRGVLAGCLNVDLSSQDGSITLSAKASGAIAAAQIVEKSQALLQEMVTEYKIEKASQNLAFVEDLYMEKKKEFEETQMRLADFRDRNLNLNSAKAKTEEERLQSEYQLALTVFSGLAQQLESSKIKLKEDTPIFSVIEPVSIPTQQSKPNKKMIVIIWIFLGGIVGVGWVFGKQFLKEIRQKWSNQE